MDRKRLRKVGPPLGALAVVLVALGLWLALRSKGAPPVPYETAPVTRGHVAAVVTASGTISPRVSVQVGSQVSGRIQALYADFNDHVKRGQVIAKIDPGLFESQVAQARANEAVALAGVASAEAALADARRQSERAAALAAKSLVAQADADTARAKLEAAEADLRSARARVEQARAARIQAETNLGYTTIASPIDGVVVSRDVDVGQTVAASLQAPTLFLLAEDLRRMEVHTDVAESDVGRLREGMQVEFTVDAYPAEKFRGVVKEVRFAPKTVQNVVTYDAVVSVDNPERRLRPGMTADVSFLVEELDDALLVPNAALRFRPPEDVLAALRAARGTDGAAPRAGDRAAAAGAGAERKGRDGAAPGARGPALGQRFLFVLSPDGRLRPVQVRLGPSDARNTAVVGGPLAEGDRVVVGGGPAAGDARPEQQRGRFGRFL